MATTNHTITIEAQTVYPGGISQLAVVERYNGRLIQICCREDQVAAGHTLVEAAQQYAQMYAAVYLPEGGAR
jgi:hypothetical protein